MPSMHSSGQVIGLRGLAVSATDARHCAAEGILAGRCHAPSKRFVAVGQRHTRSFFRTMPTDVRVFYRANSRSPSVTYVALGSHELECPRLVAADPFCGFLDGFDVFHAE